MTNPADDPIIILNPKHPHDAPRVVIPTGLTPTEVAKILRDAAKSLES